MIHALVTAPAAEPVSLGDAKAHLRFTGNEQDTLVAALIKAAREWCEGITHRALITQTWDVFLDGFPAVIELRHPPLQSVETITYVDTNGDSQTVLASIYTVDTAAPLGRVYEAYNQVWPSTRAERKAVTVRFVAGYGAAAAVPTPLVRAMLLHIENLFDHSGTSSELTTAAEALAGPYIIRDFG